MALQLLEQQKKSGTKVYRYYSIAEPYREDGRNKKRILARIGKLTIEQAQKIRQTLRITSNENLELVDPSKVICTNTWNYLAEAVFHLLWKKLKLDQLIKPGKEDIDISKILEILVINRCVNPSSKLGVIRWYASTYLENILNVSKKGLNESRVYRSLSVIDSNHKKIEDFLFKNMILPTLNETPSLFFYDLTSSYFEGENVNIGAYNKHSKDHRPDKLQVVLGLLINEQGLPFSWDIYEGNQSDSPTLEKQVEKFKKRFKISDAILVFDRGFLSCDNLNLIEKKGYHYVTGLDAPQVRDILILNKQPWHRKIKPDNVEKIIKKTKDWKCYSDNKFYFEVGTVNKRKTLLSFDIGMYKKTYYVREAKIEKLKEWAEKRNLSLMNRKQDATKKTIEKEISKEIEKRNLSKYVVFELHEYATEHKVFQARKDSTRGTFGYTRKVRSFQIVISGDNYNVLDGIFALVTPSNSPLSYKQMLSSYRQKYLIENAFREMKSIIKLRPWFVYKEEHVKAHYTICVLAYLLERALDLMLEKNDCKIDGWSLQALKEEMVKYKVVEFKIGNHSKKVLQKLPTELIKVIKSIGLGASLKLPERS